MVATSRGDGAIERALRPTEKEVDARRVEICCNEVGDEEREDYTVTVHPKTKRNKPGAVQKSGPSEYVEPITRSFEGAGATERLLKYLKGVL